MNAAPTIGATRFSTGTASRGAITMPATQNVSRCSRRRLAACAGGRRRRATSSTYSRADQIAVQGQPDGQVEPGHEVERQRQQVQHQDVTSRRSAAGSDCAERQLRAAAAERVIALLGGVDDALEEHARDRDDDAGEQEPGDAPAVPSTPRTCEGAVEPAVAGVGRPATSASTPRTSAARVASDSPMPSHSTPRTRARRASRRRAQVVQHASPVTRRSGAVPARLRAAAAPL